MTRVESGKRSVRVIVTDSEQRAALAVVRSLGRAGHQVLAVGHKANALAKSSR